MSRTSGMHLEQFYYGRFAEQAGAVGGFRVTACSGGLENDTAERLYHSASFGSYNKVGGLGSLAHGYGLLKHDRETWVAVHVRPSSVKARGHLYPDYHCIVIPNDLLERLRGNLTQLFSEFHPVEQSPVFEPGAQPLSTIVLEHPRPFSIEQEIRLLARLHGELAAEGELIGQLLACLIEKQPVAITGVPSEPKWRFGFCQATILLLPPVIRHQFTFATEVFDSSTCSALLKLLYTDPYCRSSEKDAELSWKTKSLQGAVPIHPYANYIASNWHHGPEWIINTVQAWTKRFVGIVQTTESTSKDLGILGSLMLLNQQVRTGKVPPDSLAEAISSDSTFSTLTGQEFRSYSRRLLELTAKSGQIHLMGVVTNRHWPPGLADDLQKCMMQLADQGHGDQVLRVLRDWLGRSSGSAVDPDYWTKVLHQVIVSHAEYLAPRGTDPRLLSFTVEAREMIQTHGLTRIWPELIKILIPAARKAPQLAQYLVSLTAQYTPKGLPTILADKELRQHWPTQLRMTAVHLSTQDSLPSPHRGILVAACKSLSSDQMLLLSDLARLAIQRERTYLLDYEFWRELRSLGRRENGYRKQAQQLSEDLNDQQWVGCGIDFEAALELAGLRIDLGEYARAVSLLYVLQARSDRDRAQLVSKLRSFMKNEPSLSGNRVASLLGEMEKMQFGAALMAQAYLATLENTGWNHRAAAVGLARLLESESGIYLDWTECLGLLGCLARTEGGALMKRTLEDALQKAYKEPTWGAKAKGFAAIASELRGTKGRRALTEELVRYASIITTTDDQGLFLESLKTYPELEPEVQQIAALHTVRCFFGREDLEALAQQMRATVDLLGTLQQAFEPEAGQKSGTRIHWNTFEDALQQRLHELSPNKQEELARNSREIADTLINLADKATRGGFVPPITQNGVDKKLRSGQMEPKGAIDALKRLAGLLQGGG